MTARHELALGSGTMRHDRGRPRPDLPQAYVASSAPAQCIQVQDITYPDPKRTRKHLNVLFNYIKFLHYKTPMVAELTGEKRATRDGIKALRKDLQEAHQELTEQQEMHAKQQLVRSRMSTLVCLATLRRDADVTGPGAIFVCQARSMRSGGSRDAVLIAPNALHCRQFNNEKRSFEKRRTCVQTCEQLGPRRTPRS